MYQAMRAKRAIMAQSDKPVRNDTLDGYRFFRRWSILQIHWNAERSDGQLDKNQRDSASWNGKDEYLAQRGQPAEKRSLAWRDIVLDVRAVAERTPGTASLQNLR